MKIKTLCGLVAMFFLGLAISCSKSSQKTLKENIAKETYQTVTLDQLKEKSSTYEGQRVEVKGYPLSVSHTYEKEDYGNGGSELAIVIENNQKILLASTDKGYNLEVTEAEALVRSEIDDGDYEKITIKGKYIENKLFIEEITANNHTLYFKKK